MVVSMSMRVVVVVVAVKNVATCQTGQTGALTDTCKLVRLA